jgi:hypothetical protein
VDFEYTAKGHRDKVTDSMHACNHNFKKHKKENIPKGIITQFACLAMILIMIKNTEEYFSE